MTNNHKFADAILSAFGPGDMFIKDETGEKFQAITQTDLMERLRDKGWSLPGGSGDFIYEVEQAGFKTTQGYQFKGAVRRFYEKSGGRKERSLSKYQTLVHV